MEQNELIPFLKVVRFGVTISFSNRIVFGGAQIDCLNPELTMTRMIALMVVLVCAGAYTGMLGFEEFGNKPLSKANYGAWPGVVLLVNSEKRVYYQWVNGHENLYYLGNNDDLNTALKDFAKIKSDKLEVVLRPGPGIATTFKPEKTVPFVWNLHLIKSFLSKLDQGDQIWPAHPMLTIYVDDQVDLNALQIPTGITVLELDDLKNRAMNCLTSSDETVRGWSCGFLSRLDKYDVDTMKRVVQMLNDDDNWVKLNAAGALASFEANAQSILPNLEQLATSDDQQLREKAVKTITSIKQSKTDDRAAEQHRERIAAIKSFCEKQVSRLRSVD
jgi:hypothetical protein